MQHLNGRAAVRHLKKLVIFVVAAGALLAAGSAAKAETQSSDASGVTLESKVSSTFVGRNVYSAGSVARPSSAVEGDFVALGGQVIIDQFVKGDAMAAGGSVHVRAPVGDDLRVAGGEVTLESAVGGELFASAGRIMLAKSARVATAAYIFAGEATIDGNIDGPLKISAKKISLNGEVNGDARLFAEQIELGPTAKINGALSYGVAGEIKRAAGATIGGAITRDKAHLRHWGDEGDDEAGWRRHMGGRSAAGLGSVFMYFAVLACASVFLLVFPTFFSSASERINTSAGRSIALGLIVLFGAPLLAVLLFITILGIPLGLLVLALFPAFLLMGYLVGVLFVAQRAQVAIRKDRSDSFGMRILFFSFALLLVMLLGRLPVLGALLVFLLTLVGCGASLAQFLSKCQPGQDTPPAKPASA